MPRRTHPCVRNDRSNIRGTVRLFADTVMIACLAAALWGVGAEAFCLTVFFVVWILRIALPVATRWLEAEPDTVIYFAPWVNIVNLPRVTVSCFAKAPWMVFNLAQPHLYLPSPDTRTKS